MQVRFLNLSLKHFQALFVVPVYQAWWVLANILAGSVYFDELRTYTETQVGFCFVFVFLCAECAFVFFRIGSTFAWMGGRPLLPSWILEGGGPNITCGMRPAFPPHRV